MQPSSELSGSQSDAHLAPFFGCVLALTFQTLYIGCQDALVPAYPRLMEEKEKRFRRWELEQFL